MGEFLETIIKLLSNYFNKKQTYEWRFFTVNGSEPNLQIKVANSIEYEFINSGNSIAVINGNLKIYPFWSGIKPFSIKFATNKNEVDVSVYEYDFINFKNGDGVLGYQYTATTASNVLIPYSDASAVAPFNSLQVSVKIVSRQ